MKHADRSPSGIVAIVQDAQERALYEISMAAWRERRVEWGGLLFGRVFIWNGGQVVWVAAALPALGEGTPVSFEMAPASYVLAQRLLRLDPNALGLEEVGFWHSHPHLRTIPSATDVEYHGLLFPEPGSLSIIVDPTAPAAAAYARAADSVAQVPAYAYAGTGFGPAPAARVFRPWDPDEVRDVLR